MDSTEAFSFPRISDCNYPRPIDSPPLWTPSSPPSTYQDFTEEKLISQGQTQRLKEEHKMDLLWEDFNEELSSTTGFAASATSSSREMMGEYRCGSTTTALTVAKSNGGALFSDRNYYKPGMVVVMKVLKKLFFFNDPQGKQPKRRRKVW